MSSNDAKAKESQRKQARYAVSEDCRINAAIKLRSSDASASNKDWPGTLIDLSAGGGHIQISMAAVAYIGDTCVLKLAHGGAKLEMRGSLAHYICSARYSVCGVKFDAFTAGWDQAYQSFFKAVVASATLKGGPTESATPRRYREEYNGPGHAKLVVWRNDLPERSVVGFDYTMARYAAALAEAGPDLARNKAMVGFRTAPTESGAAGGPLTPAQAAEAKWEFSLAASNLPKAIAPDIRKFLRLVS